MLIYNYQKEFLGIDEKDLKTLGFNSLSELRAEVTDFADLFVKTPGYVHNFQHVHWIDFINYADVSEESKVLINVNSKTFKATLSVSTIFLIDNPTSPAYMIYLNNLRPLSKSENENISSDVLDRELPKVEKQEPKAFTPAPEVAPAIHDAYDTGAQEAAPIPQVEEDHLEVQENYDEPLSVPEFEEAPLEVYEEQQVTEPKISDESLDVGDLSLDVFDEEESTPVKETAEPVAATQTAAPKKVVKKKVIQEEWDNGYHYDPHIASKELGLPLDLIEEFIQDFIAQAKEFKPNIYSSIEDGDVDNVKILSHKLKGVAANLRIEDAHEVLSAVSTTNDMDVIHDNLDTFYKIIAKLSGEPIEKVVVVEEEIVEDTPEEVTTDSEPEIAIDLADDDEPLTLDFKDDEDEEITLSEEIEDKDVPKKIEMPELADDDFLNIEIADDEDDIITEENPSEVDISVDEETEEIHFNKADAAKEIGIDEESFNELFNDFVTESHTIFEKIEEAIENDDLQSCRNEALKFKGMSDNMRFHEFTNELETLIHSSDKDAIVQSAEKIDASLNKISKMGA
ncbi:Hpt domain-containing protein [Sulfurimonas paralvinellae]|uniref:Hpt domain-containing protein n=1 Tax=Sulfurimonas paralvinellae TaxID=317658 RepID=A0A7M1BC21_9BACT|nr:Hpt domain-containing protein [Sulfurimonas paralvinellae]QOP46342.1 Hpt domain-containing protein [Sulfurimonas paralvinellae]